MNRRILSAALACALSLSLLTACGGGQSSSSSSASSGAASSSQSSTSASTSTPDVSVPDASTPDASGSSSSGLTEAVPSVTLTLSKSDFTLKSAGAAWQLKAAVTGQDAPELTWTSSDKAVATVAEDGTVTAVAPGRAVVTVTSGSLTAECIVRCDWEEQTEAPDSSADASSSTSSSSSAATVDLAAFYQTIMASAGENAPFMMELDAETAEMIYPGLGAISTNQKVLYMPGMSAVACEIAMVECANAADVETVKAIFQSRIDAQAEGGAWYPETIEGWKNNSKIVVNGSYVAMFVIPEGMMDAASEFNKLF